MGPTQDQPQDKTITESWHKTNTELVLDEVQTKSVSINSKKAADIDNKLKQVTSDKPAHGSPEVITGELYNIPTVCPTITRELRKPLTRLHDIALQNKVTREKETDELDIVKGEFKKPPARPFIMDVEDKDTSEEDSAEPTCKITKTTECFEVDDALSSPGNATPTTPFERPNRYAMVSNVNVNVFHIQHFKPVKPDKIKREKHGKIDSVPADKLSKFGFQVITTNLFNFLVIICCG